MKCPNCHKEGLKYIHKERDYSYEGKNPRYRYKKVDNIARCNKCNWGGEI